MTRGIVAGLSMACGMLILSSADAFVMGGSNLSPLTQYPGPDCEKPMSKPIEPFHSSSREEVDEYNAEVDEYNMELERYRSCVREYLDNADNDIKRIQEKEHDVVEEANSPD